ncbi:AAA family ATPase [Herbaspirillum rubrisubalbicans]|uniref:AAA family ATPase n=1 Tax=Herbaspirillum rubrisubalbicans TaxID=80842 RepID=UPI0015596D60|nr:ATP-binding protein [Herbaspirillum rubrisubalbicans]
MLKSVYIRSFLSCSHLRLNDLGAVSTLIGKNGAGKSNILRAIYWAARMSVGPQVSNKLNPEGQSVDASSGDVEFKLELAGCNYSYRIRRKYKLANATEPVRKESYEVEFMEILQRENSDTPILIRDNDQVEIFDEAGNKSVQFEVSRNSGAMGAVINLFPSGEYTPEFVRISTFLWKVRYYELNTSLSDDSFIMDEEFQRWRANLSSALGEPHDTNKKILDMSLHDPAVFDELKSLAGLDGLGLVKSMDIFTYPSVGAPGAQPRLHFVQFVTPSNALVTYKQLSFGTQRLFSLLVSILYDGPRIALVEQPEDGIHPSLIKKLASLLRAYTEDCQFFFASHSATILNEMQPREVRLVEMSDGGTIARPLSEDEMAAAEHYLYSEGSFSDFLSSI